MKSPDILEDFARQNLKIQLLLFSKLFLRLILNYRYTFHSKKTIFIEVKSITTHPSDLPSSFQQHKNNLN
jgi:hypothetical protein